MAGMNATLEMDRNGNQVVKISFWPGKERGFSIQTNSNLPLTHSSGRPDFQEIGEYVLKHGSARQIKLVRKFGGF